MSHYICLCTTDRKPPRKLFLISLYRDVGFCPRSQRLLANHLPSSSFNANTCSEAYCLCSGIAPVQVPQGTSTIIEEVYRTIAYATKAATTTVGLLLGRVCPYTDVAGAGSPLTTSSKTGCFCDPAKKAKFKLSTSNPSSMTTNPSLMTTNPSLMTTNPSSMMTNPSSTTTKPSSTTNHPSSTQPINWMIT